MIEPNAEMKLFAIYIGGEARNSNIELHDMRFAIAQNIEDTYESLREEWWGVPHSLHIDCWSAITRADGYSVTLKPEPSQGENKLYFLNLGGYDAADFSEVHKNMFVVAASEQKAKVKALKTVSHWVAFHKDELFEVENSFCLNKAVEDKRLYIHLEKIPDESPAPFICKYKPIGKKAKV